MQNSCPLTCKIGLKRDVCTRISDPRPRHAFPETLCAINIRTIESFTNNTLVTDIMTDQTWKELLEVLSEIQVSIRLTDKGSVYMELHDIFFSYCFFHEFSERDISKY